MIATNQYVDAVAKHGIDNIVTIEVHSGGRPKWRRAILVSEVDAILAKLDGAANETLQGANQKVVVPLVHVLSVISRGNDDECEDENLANVLLWMACTKPHAKNPTKARRDAKAGRAGIIWDFTGAPDGNLHFSVHHAVLRGDPLKRLLQ